MKIHKYPKNITLHRHLCTLQASRLSLLWTTWKHRRSTTSLRQAIMTLPLFAVIAVLLLCQAAVVLVLLVAQRRKKRALHEHDPPAVVVITQSPGNHSPRAVAHASAILATMGPRLSNVIFICEQPFPSCFDGLDNVHFIGIPKVSDTQHHFTNHTGKRAPLSLLRKLFRFARALYEALVHASQLPFRVEAVVVNVPPVLPTLPLTAVAVRVLFPHSPGVVLDVHNLAFTLMRLTVRSRTVLLTAKYVELVCMRLCVRRYWAVSNELTKFLRRALFLDKGDVCTVYDKPRVEFRRAANGALGYDNVRELLSDAGAVVYAADERHPVHDSTTHVQLPYIVSSSSWTPDEDFSIVVKALLLLDAKMSTCPIVLVLTGKGPNRAAFERDIEQLNLRNVAVVFAWLPVQHYPPVLASAQLGICLHASSSGLDLPMKAVDLLGAGIPVLALNYFCINELIRHRHNGYLFHDASSLSDCLEEMLLSKDGGKLESTLRQGVKQYNEKDENNWITHWKHTALLTLE